VDGDQLDGGWDIVDLLTAQHAGIERQFRHAADAGADNRDAAWATLARLVAVHEIIEEEAVHPLARRLDPDGHATDRLLEEEHLISDALADAVRAHPADDRDRTLGVLREMVRTHARHEERGEFARLRHDVPEAQLREMADVVSRAEDAAVDGGRPGRLEAAEPMNVPLTAERVRDALRAFSRDVLV
jgi:hypothetical protein